MNIDSLHQAQDELAELRKILKIDDKVTLKNLFQRRGTQVWVPFCFSAFVIFVNKKCRFYEEKNKLKKIRQRLLLKY